MHDTAVMESQQQQQYPGLRVRREGDAVVVHIPAKFRRRMGRFMILMEGATPTADSEDQTSRRGGADEGNQALIKTIAKAYRWQEQIETGTYADIEELAQVLKLDRSYVQRLIRVTSLAPDIVEAILRGDEPLGMSLAKLHKSLPYCWDQQRTQFGKA